MKDLFAIRLRQARAMNGMSMEMLASKINISKQAICKYEKGIMFPNSSVLIALSRCLGVSVDYLFRPTAYSIDQIEFRKKAKLGVKRIEAIKKIVRDKLECYFEIEELNGISISYNPICDNVEVASEVDVYAIANKVKQEWQLGEDGINNLIEILEENKIKVIEIEAESSFDGLSGFVNSKTPVIVLNSTYTSERKRFTALHELGHIIMRFLPSVEQKKIESLCNLFASEMLISKEVFIQKIGAKRDCISIRELIELQKQFGVSIDALMFKAQQLNVISEKHYIGYNKKKNALPSFKIEAEMSRTKEESPERYSRLVYKALACEIITISKASVFLDKPVEVIRNSIGLV